MSAERESGFVIVDASSVGIEVLVDHKRYGNTDAASVDYFRQELVRSLGQDDASVFGPNFRR